jgi:hypothetical protein
MDAEKQSRDPQINQQEHSADYWQAKVDSLQEIVCLLLLENQAMRLQQTAPD